MLTTSITVQAQNPKKQRIADPVADPNLPNVLLIGDSISIGYHASVQSHLQGIANVYRPQPNCGPTTRGLEQIDDWLGERHWDLIHWNFGLHDLKYLGANGENLADPENPTSHQQVPIESYRHNIKKLAGRIKQSARLSIWRETTPVPRGAKGRVPGDSLKYNAAAAEAIAEVGGIATDPFFAFAESIRDDQRPKDVHYTPVGSEALGKHIAEIIINAMHPLK